MPDFIDDCFCDRCAEYTSHHVYDDGHERDSSNNWRECLECGWVRYDLTEEYRPPAG